MKNSLIIIAILLVLCFAGVASASNIPSPGIDKRQKNQQQRIVQGMRSGELTPRETAKLKREQARIKKKERRFESDGVLTCKERHALHRELNRASRHIYREKHDAWHMR